MITPQRTPPRRPSVAATAGYQIRISEEREDQDWDRFVAQTPGGDHVQTSLWAQVRALLGWRATRIVAMEGTRIVAGAQLLLRRLPLAGGAIGYVPRGPLCAPGDAVSWRVLLDALHEVARAHRVQYLVVQPALNGEAVARELLGAGFRPTATEPQPAHAVVIDLRKDLDEIRARMRPKTRYNIRLGERKGITVREGSDADLDTFYELLLATGRRQHFSVHPKQYFSEMARILGPHGYIKFFVAEYAGEAVSAQLLIPFGDTVTYKRGAWSGWYGSCHPNEVMHWSAIKWSKENGYRYYDLEGIDTSVARAIAHGCIDTDKLEHGVTSFKLGFGARVVLFPGNYDYIYNRLLRWGYTNVFPKMARWTVVARLEEAVRGRGRGTS